MNIRIGSTLGCYLIEGVLGEGAVARVYQARHTQLDTLHALKLLSIHRTDVRRRFLQEGRLQSQLRHPNIVTVSDVLKIDGYLALIMDFIFGPDLAQLQHACRLSDGQAYSLGQGILFGVRAAHEAGLIHRDLKPSNILLQIQDGQLNPRISDFGLAKTQFGGSAIRLTNSGTTMGSPGYMAPEQIKDAQKVDSRADVFSLGAILYELLTGQMAFQGPNVMAVWSKITKGDFTPLEQVRHDIPDDVIAVVHGALNPSRSHRIPSAQILLDTWEAHASVLGAVNMRPAELWEGEAMDSARALVETHSKPQTSPGPFSPNIIVKTIDVFDDAVELVSANDSMLDTVIHGFDEASGSHLGNLPKQKDRFIGRLKELAALRTLRIRGTRLLTLRGPGGMGKTRLSQVFGAQLRNSFSGGVWFCDLTETHSRDEMIRVVAQSLNVQLSEADPVAQLVHAIRGRGSMMIILDNLEQLVTDAATTIGRWVELAPEAFFLVTSRELLNVPGERAYILEPLSDSEALQLFEDRAQQVRPSFTITPKNKPIVLDLIAQLDGMSLAIELAAARTQLMNPRQIRERMSQRFKLLQGGRRDRSQRHRTLRAAIEWSWDLLPPEERSALAQCSVFRSGLTLEAAEEVLDLEPWDVWNTDVIQRLVDQSLLRRVGSADQPRLQLYESIRVFAQEKMSTPGAVFDPRDQSVTGPSSLAALQLRHAAFYARLGSQDVLDWLTINGTTDKGGVYQAEVDNLKGALEFCWPASPDLLVPLTIAHASIQMLTCSDKWLLQQVNRVLSLDGLGIREQLQLRRCREDIQWKLGLLDESLRGARESLALALTLNDVVLEAIHRYRLANNMLSKQSHADNVAMALQALTCVREVGNPTLESQILLVLSFLHSMAPEAGMVYLKQAQAISEEIDSIYIQIRILRTQANFFSQMGELDRAGAYLQRALKKAKTLLNKQQEVNVLQEIGTLTKDQGQLNDSIQAHSKAIALCRAAGFRKQEAILLGNLGLIAQLNGESDRAEIIYEEALMLFQQMGHTAAQGCAAGNLGDLMLSQGKLIESSAHLNQAIALCDEKYGACFRGSLAWVRAQQGDIAGARQLLDEGEFHLRGVWVIELGRLFCRRAQVEHTAGEPEAAAEALEEARRIAKQSGAGPMSDLGQLITEAAEACRQ